MVDALQLARSSTTKALDRYIYIYVLCNGGPYFSVLKYWTNQLNQNRKGKINHEAPTQWSIFPPTYLYLEFHLMILGSQDGWEDAMQVTADIINDFRSIPCRALHGPCTLHGSSSTTQKLISCLFGLVCSKACTTFCHSCKCLVSFQPRCTTKRILLLSSHGFPIWNSSCVMCVCVCIKYNIILFLYLITSTLSFKMFLFRLDYY